MDVINSFEEGDGMKSMDRFAVACTQWRVPALGVALIATTSSLHSANADDPCSPQWSEGVGAGSFGPVAAMASVDDGESITHYIGHTGVARWTGTQWTVLGTQTVTAVRALAPFDDGTGPALHAGIEVVSGDEILSGGVFRWDESQQLWVKVGVDSSPFLVVHALAVVDDGNGAALYAGGAGLGGPGDRIARWDGRTWSLLIGQTGTLTAFNIRTIAAFDDGSGLAIYVGGNALEINGVPTPIAKWDGTNWSAVPGMPQADNTVIIAMTVHDDGTGGGPALYVGGFSSPIPQFPFVSRFDGTDWSVVATPLNGSIQALASFDDGTGAGSSLYVGGGFTMTMTESGEQPLTRVARLNGSQWEQLQTGTNGGVFALLPSVDLTDGQTPALHVGGTFNMAYGVPSASFAQWQGCDAPIAIPGDLDASGEVDVFDLLILLGTWGACEDCPSSPCSADLDGSCVVDVFDLLILLGNWDNARITCAPQRWKMAGR
jgi:hypothetical protein